VHRQTQRLIELVNDLLDLARIEARQGADFKRQVQPVQPLIKEAVEAIIVPGGKHSARIEAAADLPLVSVDGQQMGRVLNNLISNAVKYWPEGGEIVVAAKPSPHQGVAGVSLSVRDGGMGMSPQQLARAFERFFRADQACHIPGTGLGLSLVKEIVQLHGGTIHMDSALNEGTTVSIWLPVAREDVPIAPAVNSAPALASTAEADPVTS
jgi:signal transduction histidine kinase